MEPEIKERHESCGICHLTFGSAERRVVKPYGVYHESCFFKACDSQRLTLQVVMALVFMFCSFSLHAANPLPPAVSCSQSQDSGHANCEMRHYFGAWHPHWEVYRDGVLVADADALVFAPVIGDDWRTVRATIPDGENRQVFEVEVRRNSGTKKAEFRSNTDHKAVVVYADQEAKLASYPP